MSRWLARIREDARAGFTKANLIQNLIWLAISQLVSGSVLGAVLDLPWYSVVLAGLALFAAGAIYMADRQRPAPEPVPSFFCAVDQTQDDPPKLAISLTYGIEGFIRRWLTEGRFCCWVMEPIFGRKSGTESREGIIGTNQARFIYPDDFTLGDSPPQRPLPEGQYRAIWYVGPKRGRFIKRLEKGPDQSFLYKKDRLV